MEWASMDSAPLDGTAVLLFDVSGHYGSPPAGQTIMVAEYRHFHEKDFRYPGGTWEAPYGPCSASNPVAWMPLPPPPQS